MEGGHRRKIDLKRRTRPAVYCMNFLFTSVGNFQTLESQDTITEWRQRHHIVEVMPFERLASYIKFAPGSGLALIDAIICAADTDLIAFHPDLRSATLNFPFEQALMVAEDVATLPGSCAMSDGRTWNSIPFVIFAHRPSHTVARLPANAHIESSSYGDPEVALDAIQKIVHEHQDRVLAEYQSYGILIQAQNGHIQIMPALRKKNPDVEGKYYHLPADRRRNKGWVTIRRDMEGLGRDVELFQELLERNAPEPEIHAFLEQHPAFLMEARLGIPISHSPNFARPKNEKPDFAISPILGPVDCDEIDLLELKRPGDSTLNRGFHRGLSTKVKRAIDQIRDYDRYLHDPANYEAIVRAFGYIPRRSNLAVLIGRAPRNEADKEVFMRRQSEVDVEIVTYDEILQTQVSQLGSL